MLCRVVLIVTLAVIASAVGAEAGPTEVKVVNGRGAPALVTDQTVLRPVHGQDGIGLEVGQRSAILELITPPAGQMVVIEYVTIQAYVHEATANALLDLTGDLGDGAGAEVEHYLDAFPPPTDFGSLQQMLTQQVLLYSAGTVFLIIDRGPKAGSTPFFIVTFSGYLVKAPE